MEADTPGHRAERLTPLVEEDCPLLTEEEIMEVVKAYSLLESSIAPQVKRVGVGFSNAVYDVANTFILKAVKCYSDKSNLQREAFLCQYFVKTNIPVPAVVVNASEGSDPVLKRAFIVYNRLPGNNLYNVWHALDVGRRRGLVQELCGYLKVINCTDLASLGRAASRAQVPFSLQGNDKTCSWKHYVTSSIKHWLSLLSTKHVAFAVSNQLHDKICAFVDSKSYVLDQEVRALTYYDVHFDNILVHEGRISAILDLERTDILSIDFVLDTVKRMVTCPTKYASQHARQFVKEEDYKDLLTWFCEFYPELFDFAELSTRLRFYALCHDLEELYYFPESTRAQEAIKSCVECS